MREGRNSDFLRISFSCKGVGTVVTCCSGGSQPDEGWTAGFSQKAQHKKKKKKAQHIRGVAGDSRSPGCWVAEDMGPRRAGDPHLHQVILPLSLVTCLWWLELSLLHFSRVLGCLIFNVLLLIPVFSSRSSFCGLLNGLEVVGWMHCHVWCSA